MTGLRSGVDDWRKKSGGWTSSRNSWDMFQCRHGELSKQQLLGGWRSVWQEVLNVPDVCHKPCFVLHFCQLLFVSHSCVKFSFHYGRFTNCREWWIEYGQLDVRWYKVILLVTCITCRHFTFTWLRFCFFCWQTINPLPALSTHSVTQRQVT